MVIFSHAGNSVYNKWAATIKDKKERNLRLQIQGTTVTSSRELKLEPIWTMADTIPCSSIHTESLRSLRHSSLSKPRGKDFLLVEVSAQRLRLVLES